MNHPPTLTTLNNIINDDFENRIINNFDVNRYVEINNMLYDYDTQFTSFYDPYQVNNQETNNLVNSVKIMLNKMDFESMYAMIRTFNILHITYNENNQYSFMDFNSDTFIKMYIYWFLYKNNYLQERENLMNTWNNNNVNL